MSRAGLVLLILAYMNIDVGSLPGTLRISEPGLSVSQEAQVPSAGYRIPGCSYP